MSTMSTDSQETSSELQQRLPSKAPRLEDVARAAGVSPKTASRVINNERSVRTEVREKVWAAVKSLRYVPHPSARSLAANRSFQIGLLYDNPSPGYVMEVQAGVLEACQARRYGAIVHPLRADASGHLREIIELVSHHRLDGLLMTPPVTDDEVITAWLQANQVRFACISPRSQQDMVGARLDERSAARDIVGNLLRLGHRRVGHILGHPAHGASRWRLEGYRAALAEAGLPYVEELVVAGEFSFESGVTAGKRLLSLLHAPTAIFAANDDMAAGVLWAAAQSGIEVPGRLSVCGFDDMPISRQVWPPLTTVRQPCRLMGQIAAQQLIESIEQPAAGRMVVLPYELCVRGSTAPPGASSRPG